MTPLSYHNKHHVFIDARHYLHPQQNNNVSACLYACTHSDVAAVCQYINLMFKVTVLDLSKHTMKSESLK